MTAMYAVLHLLVDGLCALAMFGRFLPRGNGAFHILIYNFCAFALQMPFGVALDLLWRGKKEGQGDFSFLFAGAGVLCTIAGVFTHPAVLGIGNALFHVGGGVGSIREDNGRNWQGRGLGVFVAPGALGLYLGTLSGKSGSWHIWAFATGMLMMLVCGRAVWRLKMAGGMTESHSRHGGGENAVSGEWKRTESHSRHGENSLPGDGCGEHQAKTSGAWGGREIGKVSLCCLLVVILRSYVGMAVAFPWKSGIPAGILAVLMVVGGKIAGGFGAARYGFLKTSAVSLGLSALCFLVSGFMPTGLAALFLFNMTMPITLYWMVRSMPEMPGFAFGFLTFALFLGFLPAYFGLLPAAGGSLVGCGGSVISLLLLAAGYGCTKGWWKRCGFRVRTGDSQEREPDNRRTRGDVLGRRDR